MNYILLVSMFYDQVFKNNANDRTLHGGTTFWHAFPLTRTNNKASKNLKRSVTENSFQINLTVMNKHTFFYFLASLPDFSFTTEMVYKEVFLSGPWKERWGSRWIMQEKGVGRERTQEKYRRCTGFGCLVRWLRNRAIQMNQLWNIPMKNAWI